MESLESHSSSAEGKESEVVYDGRGQVCEGRHGHGQVQRELSNPLSVLSVDGGKTDTTRSCIQVSVSFS